MITPFDPSVSNLKKQRSAARDPLHRKILQKACIAAVRQQRQWKLEKALEEATNMSELHHKNERERQTPLSTSGNVEAETTAFETHWTNIVQHGKRPDPDEEQKIRKLQESCGKPSDFYSEDLFDKITVTMLKMKKGKSGGTDGVLAEFVKALTPEQQCTVVQVLLSMLRGQTPMPAGWKKARVRLIPKIAAAIAAGQFRPITVLPVTLKISMHIWMALASPFLALQETTSHGFRAGFQAAELHGGFRLLLSERAEWQMPLVLAKVDIAKAYDSLTWAAIQRTFERRNLPEGLNSAYWWCHKGRTLIFSTVDKIISFSATPTRGIPQGSQEPHGVRCSDRGRNQGCALGARGVPPAGRHPPLGRAYGSRGHRKLEHPAHIQAGRRCFPQCCRRYLHPGRLRKRSVVCSLSVGPPLAQG